MTQIDKMSREEIIAAKQKAADELKQLEVAEAQYDQRRLKELRSEIEATLSKEGYTLKQLVEGKVAKKDPKGKMVPKYQNPEKPSEVWSGRGRQPAWFKKLIVSGVKEEELLIK